MKFPPFLPHVVAAAAALALCSCASISVTDVSQTGSVQPAHRPRRIEVQSFAVRAGGVKENAFRKNKGQLAAEGQRLLADRLVKEFNKAGLPAVLVSRSSGAPDAWLVSGEITRLVEGSRLLRMGLGLGFGGTKMETHVAVKNEGAPRPFLTFETTGGSNATPGAATDPIPFSAAPTALLDSKEGVTDDAGRTARMIVGSVADYLAKKGWYDRSKAPQTKKPGDFQITAHPIF